MAQSIDPILNHAAQALSRFLEQYKNLPNIQALVDIYTKQIQEAEDVAISLCNLRTIDGAFGATLDLVGDIVGQERGDNTDERYRVLIYVKIGKNTSQGEYEKIINVFKLLSEGAYVHLVNLNRANIQLQSTSDLGDQDDVNFIFNNMQEVVAGGVRIAYIVCADPVDAFAYSGVNTAAPARGYNNVSNTGGKYATGYRLKLPFAYAGNDLDAEGYGAGSLDPLAGGVYL